MFMFGPKFMSVPSTVQGWLFTLYASEITVRRLKASKTPTKDLEKSRAWLYKKWYEAKQAGVTEQMFSACSENLYLEDVRMSLELSYRDACACHMKNAIPLAPCCHFDSTESCSPFCPKFKPTN